ncbi:uncharacterized protein KD926_008378 [Aspergillus affinis]|uniref:uncharacterized protein n=1 Tax=Aspergillus affinis TaxID=1070780 RepID=UPI0022FF3B71|nr:uncharacterized protein KD926_008378 [Aspergillus affinis]KAI9040288.1 hypothetical protein KD926_008378 [Aspergillus affinis]
MDRSKEVIIIGGGISGLGMAVQLKRLLGHNNFTLYEKSDNVGGTWWHNRYPACACDIPSHFYSYSFALKHDWTTMYPGRDELHAYFFSVAERFNILPHCRFNAMCIDMTWDNYRSLWVVTFQDTNSGETFKREAPVVVSAIGTLDRPAIPSIEGANTFQGETFHSAEWVDNFKPNGKRITVVGNGASATQFVPELVKSVGPRGKVTQHVRSSHWWTKRGNPTYSEAFQLTLKYVPLAARLYRVILAWQLESTFFSFYMDSNGAAMRQKIREATYSYIEEEAPARYREILKPDYEPGCKRRVNTATYLRCLHSPQMLLTKDAIVKIGPNYVETRGGERIPADAIIYATGFQTQKWLFPIRIRGIGGKDLHDAWDASGGAEAYKGTVVSDFPNFFILYGPNAATGQHSVIFHSECQINYSCRLLRPVLKGNTDSIMVKPEAQRRDLSWVHGKLQHLVFNSGCQSWWMDSVTKKNTFIYPDPMYKYWLRTIFPNWSDFTLRKSERPSKRYLVLGCLVVVGLTGYISIGVQGGDKLTHDAWSWGVFGGILENEDWLGQFNHPSDSQTGIIVSCHNLGCFAGCLVNYVAGEILGRRRTIWLAMAFVTVGAILQSSAFTVPHLVVGRLITGVGTGIKTSTVPMYQSELCDQRSRGRLVSAEVLFVDVGIVIAYWFDFGMSYVGGAIAWRLPVAAQIIFALVVVIPVIGLPESPRWLYRHGLHAEAMNVLCRMYDKEPSDSYILAERDAILAALKIESRGTKTEGLLALLKNFTVVMITPVIINRLHWKAYLIFMASNAAFVPALYFFFPETSNLRLEEVDLIFTRPGNPVQKARNMAKEIMRFGHISEDIRSGFEHSRVNHREKSEEEHCENV